MRAPVEEVVVVFNRRHSLGVTMMKIRTILDHVHTSAGIIKFKAVGGGFFEGEVSDNVAKVLIRQGKAKDALNDQSEVTAETEREQREQQEHDRLAAKHQTDQALEDERQSSNPNQADATEKKK
jgi:hypothetical protein